MATLQLISSNGRTSTQLCGFDQGNYHQSAFIRTKLQANICIADLGPVADTPTNRVILKLAWGEEQNEFLKREYKWYSTRLAHLQGSVVPRCYGLFRGKDEQRGGVLMGCLILEYVKPHKDGKVNVDEFHRQLMVALCKIHDAGLKHGDLKTSHILQKGFSPCIIDLSRAEKHRCEQAHPAAHTGDRVAPGSMGMCDELTRLEVFHAKHPEGIVMTLLEQNRTLRKRRMTLTGDSNSIGRDEAEEEEEAREGRAQINMQMQTLYPTPSSAGWHVLPPAAEEVPLVVRVENQYGTSRPRRPVHSPHPRAFQHQHHQHHQHQEHQYQPHQLQYEDEDEDQYQPQPQLRSRSPSRSRSQGSMYGRRPVVPPPLILPSSSLGPPPPAPGPTRIHHPRPIYGVTPGYNIYRD